MPSSNAITNYWSKVTTPILSYVLQISDVAVRQMDIDVNTALEKQPRFDFSSKMYRFQQNVENIALNIDNKKDV